MFDGFPDIDQVPELRRLSTEASPGCVTKTAQLALPFQARKAAVSMWSSTPGCTVCIACSYSSVSPGPRLPIPPSRFCNGNSWKAWERRYNSLSLYSSVIKICTEVTNQLVPCGEVTSLLLEPHQRCIHQSLNIHIFSK